MGISSKYTMGLLDITDSMLDVNGIIPDKQKIGGVKIPGLPINGYLVAKVPIISNLLNR
jgi:hypothetical protein